MKITTKILLLLILGCTWMSCSTENDKVIESELISYFEDFENEATARGLDIKIENIDIGAYIHNIETRGTLGQCKSYSDGSHEVVIDAQYWERISTIEREYLVFHELGHCILDREHKDEKDTTGNCISIMQSGSNECLGIYSTENRTELLDELFSF